MASNKTAYGFNQGPIPPIFDMEPPEMSPTKTSPPPDDFGAFEDSSNVNQNGTDDWCNFSGFVSSNDKDQESSSDGFAAWQSNSPPPFSPPSNKNEKNNPNETANKSQDDFGDFSGFDNGESSITVSKGGLNIKSDNEFGDFGSFESMSTDNKIVADTSIFAENTQSTNESISIDQNIKSKQFNDDSQSFGSFDTNEKASAVTENLNKDFGDFEDFGNFDEADSETDIVKNYKNIDVKMNENKLKNEPDNAGGFLITNNFDDGKSIENHVNNSLKQVDTDFFGDFSTTNSNKKVNGFSVNRATAATTEITPDTEFTEVNNENKSTGSSNISSEFDAFRNSEIISKTESETENNETFGNFSTTDNDVSKNQDEPKTNIFESPAIDHSDTETKPDLEKDTSSSHIEIVENDDKSESALDDSNNVQLQDGKTCDSQNDQNDFGDFGSFDNAEQDSDKVENDLDASASVTDLNDLGQSEKTTDNIINKTIDDCQQLENEKSRSETDFGDFDNFQSDSKDLNQETSENVNDNPESITGDFGNFDSFESKDATSKFDDFDNVNSSTEKQEISSNDFELTPELTANEESDEFGAFDVFGSKTNIESEVKTDSEFTHSKLSASEDFGDFGTFDNNTHQPILDEMEDSASNDFGDFDAFDSTGTSAAKQDSKTKDNNDVDSTSDDFGDFGAFDSETKPSDSPECKSNPELKDNKNTDSASNDFGDFGAFDNNTNSATELKFESEFKNNENAGFDDFGSFDSNTTNAIETKTSDSEKGNTNAESSSSNFGDFGAFDSNTNNATELKSESEFKNNENSGFDDFGAFDSNTTNNAIETKTSDSEKGNTNAESSSSEFGDFGAFDSNTCATKETKFGDFGTAEQEMESVNGFADFGGFAESKPTNDFGNFGNFEDQSGKSTKKTTSVAVQLCQKTLEHTLKVSDSEQNDDDNTRKRIYDLLEHVKNTFVPDTEVSFWEEMQIVKKDEDYWSIHYFSSHFFKHQINALELDYKEIKPKSSIGKHLSTPSLSPATSIGSFDMELGILQPQLVNPKNTLLAQSQNKKVSSALIERLPSLSSLHKESGSEPTSETTSLDLDFFLGGPKDETTEAQQPASTKPPPSSSAIFDLENMDVSSAPENTENSKSLQMDNEFSMFESSSPPPPQQSNDEEVFQTDSQISMDVSKNSLETVNQPKSISPESALSSSEIPFPGNASVESKTSLFIDASKALITPQSFGIDFLAREPPPINSFNDDSKIANEISNAQNSDGFGDFAASGISNLKSDSINLDNQFSTFSTFQDAQSGPPVDDKYSVFADVSTETGKSSVFEKSEEELKSDLQNALTTQSKKPELLENTGESTKPTGGDDFSGFSSFAQPEQQTSGTSIVKDFGEFSDCEKSNNSSNTNKQSSGKTSDFEGFSSFTEPPNKSTNQDAFANFGSFESIPSGSLSKTEFSTDFESNEFDDFSDNKTTGTDFDDFKSTQENQSANSAKTSDTKIESKPSDNSIDSNFGDFSVIQSDSNKQTDFTSFETCAPSTESFGDFSTGFAEFSTSSNDPKKSPSFSVDPSDKSSFSAFSTVSKTLSNPENAFANFSSPLNGTTTTASVSSDPGNTSFGDFSTFDNTSSQTIDQNQQISMLQSQSSIDAATTSDKYDIFINISDQPSTNQPIGIQSSLSDNNDFGAFSDPAPSSISSNFNHQSASSISISNKDFGEFSDASLLTTSSFKQPSMESSVPDSTIQITSIPSNMGLDHSSSFAQFSSTPQSSNNDFGAFSDTQSQSFGQFSSTTTNMNVPSSNYGQTPSSNINDFGAFEDNITSSQPSQPSSDFAHFSTSSNNPKPTTDTSSNDFGAFSDSTQPAKTSADFGRFPISPSTYNVKENAFGAFSDSITPPPPSDFAQFSSPASSSNDFDDFSSSTTTQPPSSDFGKFPSVTTATTSTLTTSTIPTTSSNTSNYFGAISNTLQPLAPTLSNDSDKYTAFSNLNQSTSSSTPELHQTTDDKYSVFSNVNVTGFSDFSSNQTNENIQQAPTNNFGNINSNPIPSSTTSNDFGDFSSASFTNTTTTDSTQIAFPTNNGFITNASFSTAQQSSNNDQFGSFNTPLPQSSSNLQMSQQSFSSAPVSSQQTPNQDFGAFNNLPMPTSVQSSSNEDFGTFNSAPNNPGFAEFSSAPRVTNTSIQSQPIQNSNDFGAFNHSAQLPSNQSDFSGFTSFASKQPPNNQIVPPNNFSMSQQSQSSHSTSQSDFGDFSTAPSNSFGSFQHQQNFNNPQQQAYNTQQIPQQTTRWNQQNQFGAQSQQMYQTNSNPKFGQRFPQSNQQNPSNPRFQAPNNPQQFYGGYQQRQMNPGNHQQHGQVRQGNPQSRGPGTYNRQPKADDPFASLSLVDNAKQLSLSVNNLNRKTKRSLNSMSTTKSGKS